MKKFLCLLLAAMFLLTCLTGCKKSSDNNVSSALEITQQSDDKAQDEFVKPQGYASVVTVTINPQFRLYLDINGIVMAVESVNADAKSIETKIAFESQNVNTVVNTLIVVANDNNFVKTDAKIDIKITEVVNESVSADKILDGIEASANDKLVELKIKAEIIVSVAPEVDNVTSNPVVSINPVPSSKPSNETDQKPETEKPSKVTKPNEPESEKTESVDKDSTTSKNNEYIELVPEFDPPPAMSAKPSSPLQSMPTAPETDHNDTTQNSDSVGKDDSIGSVDKRPNTDEQSNKGEASNSTEPNAPTQEAVGKIPSRDPNETTGTSPEDTDGASPNNPEMNAPDLPSDE